jgi:hypothetical protein
MSEAQFPPALDREGVPPCVGGPIAERTEIVYSTRWRSIRLSRLPGAIAFVQGPVTAKNVKVLKVDGRLPARQDIF